MGLREAPTGYGQQSGLFAPRLLPQYDIGISSFYGLEGARLNWNGLTIYPGQAPDMGDHTLVPHATAHFGGDRRAGTVMTLLDVWGMKPSTAAQLNMISWVPVDHEPAPPRVLDWFRASQAIPMAMSRFGEKQLEEFDPLYCPHAIDTDVYRPIDQTEARAATHLPQDRFIVGMVAANKGVPSRKAFPEALLAFKRLHEMRPDAALYLHTEAAGVFGGLDLARLVAEVGIPGDAVFLADQERLKFNPVPPDVMAQIYSSLDVLLSPSTGEGFGIPVLEANACGVPAIVTDFSAQTEVCGSGWRVAHTPYWTPQDSWQAHPDVPDIISALKAAHRRGDRLVAEMADKGRAHALKYDVAAVTENFMLPALKEGRRRLDARKARKIEGPK